MSKKKTTKVAKREKQASQLERLLRTCWDQGCRRERGRGAFVFGRGRAMVAALHVYRRVMDNPEERTQLQRLVPWTGMTLPQHVDPAYDILKIWTVCDMDEAYNWATFIRYAYLAGVTDDDEFLALVDYNGDTLILCTADVNERFAREFPEEHRSLATAITGGPGGF